MKKTFIFLLALVMALGISLVATMPVAADPGTTYYVSTTGSDVTGDGSYSDPWRTIQHAVDQVLSGDTIMVAPGTYTGAAVDKDVTISGLGPGDTIVNSGVHYGGGHPTATTAFRLDAGADGAEVSDFTINCDVNTSFYFAVFARAVDDVTIDNLEINDTVQGISNWGGCGWEITSNTITDTVAAGGGGIGIFLGALNAPSGYGTCCDNVVQYNTVDASASAEDYSCPAICLCYDLRYDGYLAVNGSEDISGNQILDNTITASAANNLIGIEVGTILGNNEADPIRDDPDEIAAVMTAAALHDNTVEDNSVDGADTGIFFYNATNLTISDNTIENNAGYGMYAEHGQSSTVITDNTFTNNDVQLMDDTDDTDTLDPLDIATILSSNTFDRAVTVDHPGASLLQAIWSSIQDAIDAAASGDTVEATAGTYDEQVTIDKSLTVQGAGNTTIIQPSSTTIQNMNTYSYFSQDFAPVVYADGISPVTIQELKIDGSEATTFPSGTDRYVGLFLVGTNATVEHVTSVDFLNYPGSNLGYNMYAYADSETTSVEIGTCSISGIGRGGIQCIGGGLNASIHDCVVTGPGVRHSGEWIANGILIWDGAIGEIVSNTVSDFAYDASGWCAQGIDGTGATSVIGNTVTDCQCGIGVWGDNVSPDPSVTISDNTITAMGLVGSEGDGVTGITVDAWNGGTATAVIEDNDLSGGGPGDGIRIGQDFDDPDAIDATISGNTIIDWDIGIFVGDSADAIDVTENEISSSTIGSKGVYIPPTTTVAGITINLNSIAGNGAYGLDNDALGVVDAAANWWGDASGPYNATTNPSGTGDSVSDNVDYSPWWGGNYMDVSHPWNWYTNDSIQEAVDAASAGDTIYVMAGTYIESPEIVIDQNLSMIGAGSTNTTIKPSGDTASRGAMLLINPDVTFHVSDLTLDGTGRKVWYALKYQGGGSVTNCDFRNIQYNPSGPDYNGIAICAYGGAYDETIEFDDNVDITGCTFTGIGRVGVLYFGPGIADSTYSGNTYVGKGDGDWLDYALDVGSGPNVTITDSTISDCTGVASSDGSTSAGIMVTDYYKDYCPAYTSTEADITGNNISGCTSGIAVGYDETDLSVATISSNTFEDNRYQVDCTPNVDVDLEATLAGNTFDRAVVVRGSGIKVPTIFSVIQDAIDAAVDGDTVDVETGTYVEQVSIIDKDLALLGEEGAIIQAPPAVSRTTRTIAESTRTFDPIIFIDGATKSTNVTMDGFEINGNNDAGSHTFTAILCRNTVPGVISANEMHSLMGSQETLGIAVYGEDTEVTIYDNSITDFSRNAVVVSGASAADVVENVILGRGYVGTGYWAQNGIQLYQVASGTVHANILSDIGWIWPGTGTMWSSTGILVMYCDGVTTVSENELTDVQVAIRFIESSFEAVENTVQMLDTDGLAGTGGIWGNPSGRPDVPSYPFDSGIGGTGLEKTTTEALIDMTFLFQGNTVTGDGPGVYWSWGIGIWPYAGFDIDASAIYNTVEGWGSGFDLWGDGSLTANINFNKISGNDYGVDNYVTTVVNATSNWWGAVTGPYHDPSNRGGEGDIVSDNVLFDPWFIDEGMTTLVSHSTYKFVYDVPAVVVALEETPVPVTFETDELGDVGYSGVRFKFDATGPGDVIFKATDSEEVEHTFVNSGFWGPLDGYNLTADYSATTDWSMNFSEPGQYNITFSLIEAPDGDVVAGIEDSEDITVRAVDILDYYRRLHEPYDEVTTLDLLAAADDWIANEVPPGFDEPITTMQLLALADEWFSS